MFLSTQCLILFFPPIVVVHLFESLWSHLCALICQFLDLVVSILTHLSLGCRISFSVSLPLLLLVLHLLLVRQSFLFLPRQSHAALLCSLCIILISLSCPPVVLSNPYLICVNSIPSNNSFFFFWSETSLLCSPRRTLC